MLRASSGAVLLVALSVANVHAQTQTPQWSVALDDVQGSPPYVIGTGAGNDGIVVNLLRSGISLAPSGLRRWRFTAAEVCTDGASNAHLDAVKLLPNGETWGLRSCYGADGPPQQHELVRLAADGTPIATTDLGARPAQWGRTRLLPLPDGVVALVPGAGGLHWLHIGLDGQILDDTFTGLVGPPNASIQILTAKLWPNGSASVGTRQFVSCNINPPTSCPRPAATLLRLSADGTERWRVEAGAINAFFGFDDDGSSLIAHSTFDEPLILRQVSASGVPGEPFAAAGGEPMSLTGAAGPVHGRYLAYSQTEQLLIDRDGTVHARRPHAGSAGGEAYAHGTLGFITGAWYRDGALVSAEDLSVLALFDVDGIDNTDWPIPANVFWSLLDDGTVYTSSPRLGDSAPPRRARVSRFAVPGSPAADPIFIDHLE
ncbi:MAG TPA: hypothetical protein VM847_00295 [Tahibacter sp.]|nr:hypothetical protein [Tahibacter sp.]